ncbi:hypothetical protein HKD37_18G050414 [Glycine soja]
MTRQLGSYIITLVIDYNETSPNGRIIKEAQGLTILHHHRHSPSVDLPAPPNPYLSSPRFLTLFSTDVQHEVFVDQSLFYSLTKLSSQGVPFEGTLVDDWKPIYSSLDARKMICGSNVDISGRLLVGSFIFECRIMHYILCRVLLPHSTNLAQATEEDLILMWALQTGRQIDWAHLVRNCMHKALRANAPLPYPHLVTLFLKHFKVPFTNEPSIKDYQANALDERTPSPPPRDPSSALLNDVLNEIRDLRAFVGERFDSMDSCITLLKDEMGFIRRCFDPPTNP